ncbi:MAG: hypothetical protein HQL11_03870 [Candidatus Omnitrophica bacterium]|nr:hypothetical protein [Candidatus Omnitrophota bacterium]
MRRALARSLDEARRRLEDVLKAGVFVTPSALWEAKRQSLDELDRRLEMSMPRNLENKREILRTRMARLEALSPLACLKRGYGVVFDEGSGAIIKSVNRVKVGGQIVARLADGSLTARITGVRPKENE